MMSEFKRKNLYSITIDGVEFSGRLIYNLNTKHITITSSFRHRNKKQKKEYNTKYYKSNQSEFIRKRKIYCDSHPRICFCGRSYPSKLPKVKDGYVYHHYIYDHINKSNYVVMMSISNHIKLHSLLRKIGYIIPHINDF